jgi:SAM-dependent methyltransferase
MAALAGGCAGRAIPSQIDYDHDLNRHTILGARATLECLFGNTPPKSLLDIGCGTGTWLSAALDLGVSDIYGVDGVPIPEDALLFPPQFFQVADLSDRIELGRRFDLVLCLEVAEHLPADAAPSLIATLVSHSDLILFSAAAPGQVGQHHVNCQWPSYWQDLFNAHGYSCDDSVRWRLWNTQAVEPWYRQNIFVATRLSGTAGREPRINPVIHPDMLRDEGFDIFRKVEQRCIEQIETGLKSAHWYASLLPRVICAKVCRRLQMAASRPHFRS